MPKNNALDLDAIRARADAATEGPWIATTPHDDESEWASDFDDPMVITDDSTPGNFAAIAQDICQGETDGRADAEFIAHARTDVPALLAEVEQLRTVVWRVVSVTQDTDGQPLDPDTEIPVGEVARMLFELHEDVVTRALADRPGTAKAGQPAEAVKAGV